jgi:hypothetical protein
LKEREAWNEETSCRLPLLGGLFSGN